MKKTGNQSSLTKTGAGKKTTFSFFAPLVFVILFPFISEGQQSYTFTNCSSTGTTGPTQLQINSAYSGTNGVVQVNVQGIQQWTVPATSNYRIEAWGATAGTARPGIDGRGRKLSGEVLLLQGTVLSIVVGQQGLVTTQGGTNWKSGGGGASWVYSGNTPYLIAGGGGGAGENSASSDAPFNTNFISGSAYWQTTVIQTNNVAGSGGPAGGIMYVQYATGAGGAGWNGDGVESTTNRQALYNNRGKYRLNGFIGGTASNYFADGGFGGGAAGVDNTGAGGGGGGYTGGPGGDGYVGNPTWGSGGGGSSYWATSFTNVVDLGVNTGMGRVIITALCNITLVGTAATGTGAICSGQSVTLTTNAINSYSWSTGASTSSLVLSPTITTTYSLTATSPSNCTASSLITVTVNNTPSVSAVVSPSVVCAGKPVIMTAIGATTYTWTSSVPNAATYIPLNTSGYTVTGTNACGNSTAAVSVTVNPLPSITASINNPTVCSGSSIVLIGGGSVSGYTWTGGAPNNSAFVPPATTNYIVTGAGANGCTNTAVASVTVLVTPTITPVATPTAMCLGATATLSAVGATGYTWTPGSNLTAATVTVSPPGPTTYTVFRTNGLCSSTSTVFLNIYALPLVNASATPSQICAGTGVNMVVVGPITNTWLPGGFTSANFTVYPNFSTNYTVTGSNGNCTATAVVSVSVNPTPTVNISTSALTICQGQNVTLTGGGAITYTWLPMNTNNQVEVANPSATTLYTLTGGNTFGCTASVNQVIVVNQLPNMNLTSNLPYICSGNTASLSITSPTTNVVYNWNTGPTGTSILVSPTITTNYFATGTNTITGCQNTNTITLAVYISTFAVSGPTAICKGESAVFSAAGDATTYAWTANGSPVGNGVPSVTVSPIVNTTYYVVGANVSCTSTVSVPLIVNSIPNVVAVAAKSQICRFEVSTIVGTGATSYSWNTGASTPTISFTLSVTTTYTLTGTDINGCSKTTTVTQFVATCIGLDDKQGNVNAALSVYPNPNSGNFFIRSDVSMTLHIVNTLGQVVSTIKLSEDNPDSYRGEITVNSLPTGIYFITGEANGIKVNKKVIVDK